MFMLEYRTIGWWYWLVTVSLLTAGVSGWPTGFQFAIGLTVFQLLHFTIRERSMTAFTVQVRFAYLLLLLIALPEPLHGFTGFRRLEPGCGFCAATAPWPERSRSCPGTSNEAFSVSLLRRTYLSAPVRGSILQG